MNSIFSKMFNMFDIIVIVFGCMFYAVPTVFGATSTSLKHGQARGRR